MRTWWRLSGSLRELGLIESRRSSSDYIVTRVNTKLAQPVLPVRQQRRSSSANCALVPEDWVPSDEDVYYAEGKGLLTEEFIDYHLAHGTVAVNWSRMWRRWCRSSIRLGYYVPVGG